MIGVRQLIKKPILLKNFDFVSQKILRKPNREFETRSIFIIKLISYTTGFKVF